MRVFVNGKAEVVEGTAMDYEMLCLLSGLHSIHNPSATYHTTRKGDDQRSGILSRSKTVELEENMRFDICYTGGA